MIHLSTYLQDVNRFFRLFKYLHIIMLLRYIIWIFVIYALYRLIFHFIIPVVRVSGQMKKKMREFQENVQQPYRKPEQPVQSSQNTKQKTGDYIDFEELK